MLALVTASPASQHSTALVADGAKLLQQQQYAPALKLFDQAIQEDPADAEAFFFAGAALNRLGQHSAALERLDRAKALADKNPHLEFERGWSLLLNHKWHEAIEALKSYDKTHPGRGQTSEFIGRAYLALEDFDEADACFKEAIRRDPRLQESIGPYQAAIDLHRGHLARAAEQLSEFMPVNILSTTDRFFSNHRIFGDPLSDKSWQLSLITAYGYNSDARGFKTDLSTNKLPGEDSMFIRTGVDAIALVFASATDHVTLGYSLQSDFYTRRSADADLVDQTLYLEFTRDLDQAISVSLFAADEFTLVNERAFRNRLSGQITLHCNLMPGLSLEPSYSYNYDVYPQTLQIHLKPVPLDPSLPPQKTVIDIDPDAQTHNLILSVYCDVPRTPLKLRRICSRLQFYHQPRLCPRRGWIIRRPFHAPLLRILIRRPVHLDA